MVNNSTNQQSEQSPLNSDGQQFTNREVKQADVYVYFYV